MKIGELAQFTGTPVETIRFYEREQLLPAPPRTEGNYRTYDAAHAERLAFIRHCRSLDMTLAEIRVLLGFKDAPHGDCGAVNSLLDEHIGHVAERIKELRTLERHLKALRQQCAHVQPTAECGILVELSDASRASPLPLPQPPLLSNSHAGHVHGTHRHGAARSK